MHPLSCLGKGKLLMLVSFWKKDVSCLVFHQISLKGVTLFKGMPSVILAILQNFLIVDNRKKFYIRQANNVYV